MPRHERFIKSLGGRVERLVSRRHGSTHEGKKTMVRRLTTCPKEMIIGMIACVGLTSCSASRDGPAVLADLESLPVGMEVIHLPSKVAPRSALTPKVGPTDGSSKRRYEQSTESSRFSSLASARGTGQTGSCRPTIGAITPASLVRLSSRNGIRVRVRGSSRGSQRLMQRIGPAATPARRSARNGSLLPGMTTENVSKERQSSSCSTRTEQTTEHA